MTGVRVFAAFSCLLLAACSSAPQSAVMQPAAAPTLDAATRTMPVIAGRPARVFVFAGWDAAGAATAAPQVTVTSAPGQGDISLRPGQTTSIAASAGGTCAGRTVTGTGVYYTPKAKVARSNRAGCANFLQ